MDALDQILSDLEVQMQSDPNTAYQAALKYYSVSQARNSIPSSEPRDRTLQLDERDLLEDTEIEAGYAYIYLDVIVGPVTIGGLTWETGYVLNREPVRGARYPAISLQIPPGKKIRLVGAK